MTAQFPFLETSIWASPQDVVCKLTKYVLTSNCAPGSMVHIDSLLYVQPLLLLLSKKLMFHTEGTYVSRMHKKTDLKYNVGGTHT